MLSKEIKSERELVLLYFLEGPGKDTPLGQAFANTLLRIFDNPMVPQDILSSFLWQLCGKAVWVPTRRKFDRYLAELTGRPKVRRPAHPHALVRHPKLRKSK